MFSSLPIISIELNNSYVKVVEAKRKGDALKILAYKEMDVKNVNVVSEVYNELDILAALNDYLVGKDVSKYEVNIVISGVAKLLVREVVIPKLPQRKIYNLLKMEANQYFPVNLENYVIDYKIIEEFKENNAKKLKILVFAVSRYVIEQIINIAKMLKLKVNRIDLEPNALSKFILRSGIGRRETAMIVNLERSFIT
ncbi:MAG: pilus assembly protein PilM, partial [Endomicrobia bacterium]|nr:pilus assembly protein PilM [Endomicrobiia bacterium]